MDLQPRRDAKVPLMIGPLLIFVMTSSSLLATEIRGRAADNAGAHVSGAIAILSDAHKKEVEQVTADSEGNFKFENVGEGKYSIDVLPPAHYKCAKPTKRKVRVIGTDPVVLEIRLDFTQCMMQRVEHGAP